jgi:hypothetical protein
MGMEFHVDLGVNRLVRGVGQRMVVSAVELKARDAVRLDVRFWRGGAVAELPEGSLLVFVVKDSVAAGAETLAAAYDWELVEPGHYRAALDLDTGPLDAALGDEAGFSAVAELTWSADGGSNWESGNTLRVAVVNDVYKGGESAPAGVLRAADWLLGGEVPSNGEAENVTGITGSMTPDASGALVEVAEPNVAVYPGTREFTTDGEATAPGTGVWVRLYTAFLQVPENAVLNAIAPPENYTAANSSAEASTVAVLTVGAGFKNYWLYYNSGNPYWEQSGVSGVDAGEEVIAAGKWLFPNTKLPQKTFIGGLGAEWESSLAAVFWQNLSVTNDGVVVANWVAHSRDLLGVEFTPSTLVPGSASGTASVTGTPGTPGTPTPPYLRVADGRLFVRDAGVWKELDVEL